MMIAISLARFCPAGERCARPHRTARRRDQPVLWQRKDGSGAEGVERARGKPAQQCPACQRVRRPRALLDLPHPHHRRLQRPPRAVAARGVRARRVGTADPSIRLACQLRPTNDLSFFQLFLPQATSANSHASNPARIGQERYLVSMFVDMRGSTQLAESGCRSTRSSSSTASSARCRRLCLNAAAGRTSSSATACWRFRAERRPATGLPAGAAGGGDDRRQYRRIESIPEPRFARTDRFGIAFTAAR